MEEHNRRTPAATAAAVRTLLAPGPGRRLSIPVRERSARGQAPAEAQGLQHDISQGDSEHADNRVESQRAVREGDDGFEGVTDADRLGVVALVWDGRRRQGVGGRGRGVEGGRYAVGSMLLLVD